MSPGRAEALGSDRPRGRQWDTGLHPALIWALISLPPAGSFTGAIPAVCCSHFIARVAFCVDSFAKQTCAET